MDDNQTVRKFVQNCLFGQITPTKQAISQILLFLGDLAQMSLPKLSRLKSRLSNKILFLRPEPHQPGFYLI